MSNLKKNIFGSFPKTIIIELISELNFRKWMGLRHHVLGSLPKERGNRPRALPQLAR